MDDDNKYNTVNRLMSLLASINCSFTARINSGAQTTHHRKRFSHTGLYLPVCSLQEPWPNDKHLTQTNACPLTPDAKYIRSHEKSAKKPALCTAVAPTPGSQTSPYPSVITVNRQTHHVYRNLDKFSRRPVPRGLGPSSSLFSPSLSGMI